MRFARAASAMVALALLSPLAAAAQPPEPSPLAGNAAVQYWQAFHHMPTLAKEQEDLLNNWQTTPLDDAAVNLITSSKASLMYLHRGAKLPGCDWGLDYNDGIGLLLPHLAKARQLAQLAALRGRYEFEHGNRRSARDDAMAIMVLSRHVGRDPILISHLVRLLIESMVVNLVSPYVPELKASPADVLAEFNSLPAPATLQQAVLLEKKYMAGYIVKDLNRLEQEKAGSWRAGWQAMLGEEGPKDLKEIESLDKVTRFVEDLMPIYDPLAKFVALPQKEFEAQYPPFKEKVQKENPLAALLLPAIDKVRNKENQQRARMEMLLAAITIAHDGPDAAKKTKDPFGDGPFDYKPLEGGFELKSQLLFDGKPVALTVGKK